GLYEVSDAGDVRSLPRPHTRGKVLKPIRDKRGYLRVGLSKCGQVRTRLVHHLVLEAFVGPRPEGQECRHLEGDPSDNRLRMIEWGTPRQNGLDQVRHGTHQQSRKTHCKQGHPYDEENTHWYE